MDLSLILYLDKGLRLKDDFYCNASSLYPQ